jgi:hypothetical protein
MVAKQKESGGKRNQGPVNRMWAIYHGGKPDWRNEQGDMFTHVPECLMKWIDARWSYDPSKRGDMKDLLPELDAMIKSITQARASESEMQHSNL